MDWWMSSIIVGVVSGLLCAAVTWYIKPLPRIRICRDITLNPKTNKYHFKIQNIGISDISILSLYIILCFKGEYYSLKGIEIPLMHSARSAKKLRMNYTFERLVIIDVMRLKEDTIAKSNDEELQKRYKDKCLSLKDFIENDKDFKIFVGIMALNCDYNTTRFYTVDLKPAIKEGMYVPGKCTVEKHQTPIAD